MSGQKILCVHHNDIDGLCSAEIVRLYYSQQKDQVEFFEMDYGEKFPFERCEDYDSIVMVDFSLQPFDRMVWLRNMIDRWNKEFIWIDHHNSAIEESLEYAFESDGLRRNGQAACELCWEFFFQRTPDEWHNNPTPPVVYFCGRYDVWDHVDERVLPLHFAFESMNLEPGSPDWGYLFGKTENGFPYEIKLGKQIIKYVDRLNANYIKNNHFDVEFEGYCCVAANLAGRGSGRFESVKEDHHDACMSFCLRSDGLWDVRIYAYNEEMNVGELCKKHGGGGHRNCGGFQTQNLPSFLKI